MYRVGIGNPDYWSRDMVKASIQMCVNKEEQKQEQNPNDNSRREIGKV